MKHIWKLSIASMAVVIGACTGSPKAETKKDTSVEGPFPKGEKITNDNFKGTAWLQPLVAADTIYNASSGQVTFEPGARTKWHRHPGGQILLVTAGQGYVQDRGKQKRLIQKGDIIKCPPGGEHWHGATKESGMSHITIGTNPHKAAVVWMEHVTDEEFNK